MQVVKAFDIGGVAAAVAGGYVNMGFGREARAGSVGGGDYKGAVLER